MTKMISTMVLVALAAGTLTGCDAQTANAPGNATLGGAGIGALSGAAIGAAVNRQNPLAGAGIGAAVGGLGGAAIGNTMERNRDIEAQRQAMYGQPMYGPTPGSVPPPARY